MMLQNDSVVLNKNLDHYDRTRWVRRGASLFGLS
jgi:hypothetical protein